MSYVQKNLVFCVLFRTYAEQCAEVLKSEDEITAVYEALDKVNINGLDATDDDIATVLDKMSVFNHMWLALKKFN